MKKMIIYIHGKGGNTDEAEHFAPLFPDSEGVGLGYSSETPMEAKHEFPCLFDSITAGSDTVTIIANSSWGYLHYIREHPIKWEIPTCILYGENDDLTSIDTITRFAESLSAPLTVMKS